MWLRTIFRRRSSAGVSTATPLDERFLRRLERLSLAASRQLRGGLSGVHPSRRHLPAPIFTDHRPYSTGDDLRYVDWNAYARLDQLQVKLGEAEQDIPVYLLVDCSASMDWGAGDQNKLHYARLLAAAIGYVALAGGDRLHVIGFGEGRAEGWGPAGGRQRIAGLLRYLMGLKGAGTATITGVLEQLVRETRGGLLIVLSDLLHSGDLIAGPRPVLASFHAPRWQVLLLHLLHPGELQPDLRGEVELVDSETGERLAVDANRGVMEQYTTSAGQWCDAIAEACARRDIFYARLTTDLSVERAALPYLRMREALR